jgi:diguanylate cyclase (GGDEF)-like protein
MVMDARDFAADPNRNLEDPGLSRRVQIDLCAPMVDSDDQTTVGIITVGAMGRYPRNEKKMIKMVADLGSMGIKNAEYHQRIQTLANEDGLTRLYNKRFGSNQLSLGINSAEQQGQPLSVFLFDIDHFKNYNDTQGHLGGDEVLRQIGRIVQSAIRADDFAARFGGEEFLVVFHDTDKEGALIAAEKIRRQIEGFPFANKEAQPGGKLTISGGVSSFPTDSSSSTELVRLADEALYAGKQQGRNRVIPCRTPYLSAGSEDAGPPLMPGTA